MYTKTVILVLHIVFAITGSTYADWANTKELNMLSDVREMNDFDDKSAPLQPLATNDSREPIDSFQLKFEDVITTDTEVPSKSDLILESLKKIRSLVYPPCIVYMKEPKYNVTSKTKGKTCVRLEVAKKSGNKGVVRLGYIEPNSDDHDIPIAAKILTLVDGVEWEAEVYEKLMPCDGITKFITAGQILPDNPSGNSEEPKYALVVERMADNLGSLRSLCGGKLSKGTVIQVVRDVIPTLEYIHSKNLLHNKIRQSNLMIPAAQEGVKGCCKITDFTNATYYTLGDTANTSTPRDITIETIVNMSTYTHDGYHPHPRDDLQSLLFLMMSLITGEDPFERLSSLIQTLYIQSGFSSEIETLLLELRKIKEAYLEEFTEKNPEFREVITCISNLGSNHLPIYDFLWWQLERIAFVLRLTSSVFDWVTQSRQVFGTRDVMNAAIDVLELSSGTYKVVYYLNLFYTNLLRDFKNIQERLVIVEELSALALTQLKNPNGKNSIVIVSEQILLPGIQKAGLGDFTKSKLIIELLKSNNYIGCAYIYDSKTGTIKIGVVIQNLKFVWGLSSIKDKVRNEAELLQYQLVTFREEDLNNNNPPTFDYKKEEIVVPIVCECPLEAVVLGLNAFREHFCMSLFRGEWTDITCTSQDTWPDTASDTPTLKLTFKLRYKTDFTTFMNGICLALKSKTVKPWTWSLDEHTPWPTELDIAGSSTGVGGVKVVRLQNVLIFLGSECVSLNPTGGASLPVYETEQLAQFLSEYNSGTNVRMRWRRDSNGGFNYMFMCDVFYRDLIFGTGTEAELSSKFCRPELRQLANDEATKMTWKLNLAITLQRNDSFLLFQVSMLDNTRTVEDNLRVIISHVKNTIQMWPDKQNSEIVSFALGFTVRFGGTVNVVVYAQLYFHDILKILRTITDPKNKQGDVYLERQLQPEVQAVLSQSLGNLDGSLVANSEKILNKNPGINPDPNSSASETSNAEANREVNEPILNLNPEEIKHGNNESSSSLNPYVHKDVNKEGNPVVNPDGISAGNPNALLSILLSYEQFCNVKPEYFPALAAYLKVVQVYQVGIGVRFFDAVCQICIVFQNRLSNIADYFDPCNHLMIKKIILAQYRGIAEKGQLDGIEINQTEVVGNIRKVISLTDSVYSTSVDDVADVIYTPFLSFDSGIIENLPADTSAQLYFSYKRSSQDINLIEFRCLGVVSQFYKTPVERFYDELGTLPEFKGFTFSTDARQNVRDDDPWHTDIKVAYFETFTDKWDDAVRYVVKEIQKNVLRRNKDEWNVLIRTIRNEDDNSYICSIAFDNYYAELEKYYNKKGLGDRLPLSNATVRGIANELGRKMEPQENSNVTLVPSEAGFVSFQTTVPFAPGKSAHDLIQLALNILFDSVDVTNYLSANPHIGFTLGYAVNKVGSLNAVLLCETDHLEVLLLINEIRETVGAPPITLITDSFGGKASVLEQKEVEEAVEFSFPVPCTDVETTKNVYLKFIHDLPKDSMAFNILLARYIRQVTLTRSYDSESNSTTVKLRFAETGDSSITV